MRSVAEPDGDSQGRGLRQLLRRVEHAADKEGEGRAHQHELVGAEEEPRRTGEQPGASSPVEAWLDQRVNHRHDEGEQGHLPVVDRRVGRPPPRHQFTEWPGGHHHKHQEHTGVDDAGQATMQHQQRPSGPVIGKKHGPQEQRADDPRFQLPVSWDQEHQQQRENADQSGRHSQNASDGPERVGYVPPGSCRTMPQGGCTGPERDNSSEWDGSSGLRRIMRNAAPTRRERRTRRACSSRPRPRRTPRRRPAPWWPYPRAPRPGRP